MEIRSLGGELQGKMGRIGPGSATKRGENRPAGRFLLDLPWVRRGKAEKPELPPPEGEKRGVRGEKSGFLKHLRVFQSVSDCFGLPLPCFSLFHIVPTLCFCYETDINLTTVTGVTDED